MAKQHINPVHLIIPKGMRGMEVLDRQNYSLITKFFQDFPGLTFSEATSTKACDIISAIETSNQNNILVLCQYGRINFISKDVSKKLSLSARTVLLVGFSSNHDYLSMITNVSYALGTVRHTFPMLARLYNGRAKIVT